MGRRGLQTRCGLAIRASRWDAMGSLEQIPSNGFSGIAGLKQDDR